MEPVEFVIRALGEFYLFLVVMRFILQMTHADYYNPISQSIARLTNVPTLAISRVIPRLGKLDLSALLYAITLKTGLIFVSLLLTGKAAPDLLSLSIIGVCSVLNIILTLYFWLVLASVILSWVAPDSYHPGPQIIRQVTEPLFKTAQKVLPPIGGLDLSPILIFIIIQLIQHQIAPLVR